MCSAVGVGFFVLKKRSQILGKDFDAYRGFAEGGALILMKFDSELEGRGTGRVRAWWLIGLYDWGDSRRGSSVRKRLMRRRSSSMGDCDPQLRAAVR